MDSPSESEQSSARLPFTSEILSEFPTYDGSAIQQHHLIANRYAILAHLGKGGVGEVWHAFDQKLRVDIALKSLRFDVKRSKYPIEALRNEVRTARQVISSNVCRIFDLVIEKDHELISMEYIDGLTLTALLIQKGPLDLQQSRDIAAQFLAGLEAIHQAGLVHRDLKPENIMITRAGRVVVMDFGIAKEASQEAGTIAGTPPYMAPEVLSGKKADSRSDVYSAGVVLAEMIHSKRILSIDTRQEIWRVVRENPVQLMDSPWKKAILRAVAEDPRQRFASAAALSRALDESVQHVETLEERNPYPGLSSFTSENSEYFFGRELEVENALKKLQQLHLMGLVGPSGAGKTSFLRAGLIPALPKGWSYIFCVPGDSPMLNLAQAFISHFSGHTEAMQRILRFEDPKNASWLFDQWRSRHAETILIIDRFEELFTLNPLNVQESFTELIAGASLESDVRVLVSIRDDFLLRCNDFAPLLPLFSELTPLGTLNGSSLRRALVQPALKAGYRFEDEALIDEILSVVEDERGALPLMAFAAARLWEKRDHQSGQLTRQAYQEIGGVGGALARHAEKTMERIGAERQNIVREIFRNLITAQNTRAARDTEELLGVFTNRAIAEEVLRDLISARLLTSFEAPSIDGEKNKSRVEIIHESLLSAWPRLIRWQTQDADSAQLRDQLRQAANLWQQRNRSEDLLWTGTAFLEFQAWRQRYPGNLSTTEEAFAQAMIQQANKRRRKRRLFISTTIVVLLLVIAVISSFWHKARASRDEALIEKKRAQASNMLALGRAIADADPSTKLAYALSSLEFYDNDQARRFAMQALSEGPPAQILQTIGNFVWDAELSPDGKWLAATVDGGVQLFSQGRGTSLTVIKQFSRNLYIQWKNQFSPDSRFLLCTVRKTPNIIKVWSIYEKKTIRLFKFEGLTICFVRAGTAFFITDISGNLDTPFQWGDSVVRRWKFDNSEPQIIDHLNLEKNSWRNLDIDFNGRMIAYTKQNGVWIHLFQQPGNGIEKQIGSHTAYVDFIRFRPNTEEIASSDTNGEIRLWSMISSKKNPIEVIPGSSHKGRFLWFDPKGLFLFAAGNNSLLRLDLQARYAEPITLRTPNGLRTITFDQNENWMGVAGGSTVSFYPITHITPYSYRATTQNQGFSNVRFTPDAKSFINSFSHDGLLITSMPAEINQNQRMLWNSKEDYARAIDIDPFGKYLIAALASGGMHLITISDGKDITLKGQAPFEMYYKVAFSPDGKFAAAAGAKDSIEVWDIQTGISSVLPRSKGLRFFSLTYSPDGTLFAGSEKGQLYHWNFKRESLHVKQLGADQVATLAISKDGGYIAATSNQKGSQIMIYKVIDRKLFSISSHGNRIISIAFDPSGKKLITGDADGIIRVGAITGEAPYELITEHGPINYIDVDPSGKWIATSGNPLQIFAMPQETSLDTLAYKDVLKRLRNLTNVRALPDKNSPTGYRIGYDTFPGWEKSVNW